MKSRKDGPFHPYKGDEIYIGTAVNGVDEKWDIYIAKDYSYWKNVRPHHVTKCKIFTRGTWMEWFWNQVKHMLHEHMADPSISPNASL